MNIYKNSRWSKRILTCLLAVGLVVGCGSSYAQEKGIQPAKFVSGDSNGKLVDQGQLRTYYIHIPKSYNPSRPMPLLLVFHGDGGSGRSISNVTGFNTLADQKGFIVVYPDGINQKWGIGTNSKNHIDDVSFISNLIDHLKSQLNVDSHKVYATGFSKGGILTQALACKLNTKIAAFASVAGSLPARIQPDCQPKTPVSMLTINGTNDQEVYYQGDKQGKRGALISIPAMVNFWEAHDQCTSSKGTPQANNLLKTTEYSSCNGNSQVVQLAVVNGGHFWPGGVSTDASVNKFNAKLGLNASKTIWDFFQNHNLS